MRVGVGNLVSATDPWQCHLEKSPGMPDSQPFAKPWVSDGAVDMRTRRPLSLSCSCAIQTLGLGRAGK